MQQTLEEQELCVIAIACSDMHLSHKAPIWRSCEEDWYDVMHRALLEVETVRSLFDCSVLCAGDIFDKWNSTAELINFAMLELPNQMYSIAGQHDMPDHRSTALKRSAYGSVYIAEKTVDIPAQGWTTINFETGVEEDVFVYGFPWGAEITKKEIDRDGIHIALVHEYCWTGEHVYPGAPETNKARASKLKTLDYDIYIYGDNHKGFKLQTNKGQTLFNCGSLMRRKSDEKDYKPQIGIILDDKTVLTYYLDTSEDKHLEGVSEESVREMASMSEFFAELRKLGNSALDFTTAITEFMRKHKTVKEVQQIVREAMENGKG